MDNTELKPDDIVKFKDPAPEEIGLTMTVIEVNRDRLTVMDNLGWNINPIRVIRTADVIITG